MMKKIKWVAVSLLILLISGCYEEGDLNIGSAVYTIGPRFELTERVFVDEETVYYLDEDKLIQTDEEFKSSEVIKDGLKACGFVLQDQSVLLICNNDIEVIEKNWDKIPEDQSVSLLIETEDSKIPANEFALFTKEGTIIYDKTPINEYHYIPFYYYDYPYAIENWLGDFYSVRNLEEGSAIEGKYEQQEKPHYIEQSSTYIHDQVYVLMTAFKKLVPPSDLIHVRHGNHNFDDLLVVDPTDFSMRIAYRSEKGTRIIGIDEKSIYLYKDGIVQRIGLEDHECIDEQKVDIDLSQIKIVNTSFYSCGRWIWIYQGDKLIDRIEMNADK